MGLSRNKVAVSEGAAGSPPFYGESEKCRRVSQIQVEQNKEIDDERAEEDRLLFNFEGSM